MFYANPTAGNVSIDLQDFIFLEFRNGRENAKLESLQIKWKNLRNTHLPLENSCV